MDLQHGSFWFLNDLNERQKDACVDDNNILLKACPGSGKTRTLTYKLAYISDRYKPSKKLNVAITYTNRAANEIKRRLIKLDVDMDTIWAGTIHQFCLEFIIRPYSMYNKRISKGFHVIDEYVKRQYLSDLASELNIKVDYNEDPLSYPEIFKHYREILIDNKELDFEDILEVSIQLLDENHFVSDNIGGLLRCLFIDEYQDTNEKQYYILSQIVLSNKHIQIMFVGDTNQAIYGGIGGIAKDKSSLEKEFGISLVEKSLDGCYRSTQRIINFYSNFQVNKSSIFAVSDIKDKKGWISYNRKTHKTDLFSDIAKIIRKQLEQGIPEEEICIVAPQWYLLYPLSKKIKKLLPNVNFDAPNITPIKYDPMNIFYLISKLLFTKPGNNTWHRKQTANEIITILYEHYNIYLPKTIDNHKVLKILNSANHDVVDGVDYLKKGIEYFFLELQINLQTEVNLMKTYDDFIEETYNRINKHNMARDTETFRKCFNERKGVVINTFHGLKGEEYTTVIAFGILNGYIPHWNTIFNKSPSYRLSDTNRLLYVVCSRAKKNIFLFSECGRYTKSDTLMHATDELVKCNFQYDSERMEL